MSHFLDKVSVYTDGGSRGNPGPAAIGILIYSPSGSLLADFREHIGDATNNQAEYAAVLKGLMIATRFTDKEVSCHSDSELTVKQLSGSYKVKNRGLAKAFKQVKEAQKAFVKVTFQHRPRTNPKIALADKLVNRALDETKPSKFKRYGPSR